MVFVDSHVHIYDCFDIDLLLDSALENFRSAAQQDADGQPACFMLLLTEGKKENWFRHTWKAVANSKDQQASIAENWIAGKTDYPEVLVVFRKDSAENKLYIVAGRQVVTAENIEVLGLLSRKSVSDGLSLTETITSLQQAGAIPVLPWGVGKWIGARGKKIEYLLENEDLKIYLGDNGGRPCLWPTPKLFLIAAGKNVAVLPGSDALPLKGEAGRAGSFGFFFDAPPGLHPFSALRRHLLSRHPKIIPFGHLQRSSRFVRNQLALRFS